MRWEALFDDLEAQLEAEQRAERASEAAELARLELSRQRLADRLRAATGTQVSVGVAGTVVTGRISRSGADWALLAAGMGEVAVVVDAVAWWSGLPRAAEPVSAALTAQLGIGHVLRRLSRDRSPVTIVLRDASARTGTIDRVGADFLDLAEHAPDVVRRQDQVSAVRTLAFAALALIRPA